MESKEPLHTHYHAEACGVDIPVSSHFLDKDTKLRELSGVPEVTQIAESRGSTKTQVHDFKSRGFQCITWMHQFLFMI